MKIPFLKQIKNTWQKFNRWLPGDAYNFFFGPTNSGKTVTERTAMQTTAVYACVRILAETMASLPLHLYLTTADGHIKATDHQLYFILHDEPNPEMTAFTFRETLMTHLLLWGNAYAQIIRDGRGGIVSLYPLMPDRMLVERGVDGQLLYTYLLDIGGYEYLSSYEVLHIPGLGFDGLVGYSPIAMAKNAIGMSLATEEYGASFFANGANPGGVLEHPGKVKDPKKMREAWDDVYKGTPKAHKVAILEEGLQFKAIGIPPEQAQFIETRKFQINEIARIFRVPPHMLADLEKSSFSNIEQMSLEFIQYAIDPWAIRWEQALQRRLFNAAEKRSMFLKHNVDGLLRGDFKTRMDGYAVGRQNGWLSTNDIRTKENMNRISAAEGGDLYLVNGSMTKLADAGAFANKSIGGEK